MNRHNDDVINPLERVVKVTETCDGVTRSFYAIHDRELGYWRGTSALDDYYAWTRDTTRRAEFARRADAIRELKAIWDWRRARAGRDEAFMNILRKGKAAA
mgnify:CR=1 FL=1